MLFGPCIKHVYPSTHILFKNVHTYRSSTHPPAALMGRDNYLYSTLLHCHSFFHQEPQSRQRTKLFLQSSELGRPTPSPGGRGTLACGRGGGGSQIQRGDIHCGTLGIHICTLCREQNIQQTFNCLLIPHMNIVHRTAPCKLKLYSVYFYCAV
jgi:hypothetical protein